MSQRSNKGAPAFVGESAEKLIAIENEALRFRSRKEALIDAIARFVGTISFVVVQGAVTVCWAVVNAGIIPAIKPFDPFPYPLLSVITSFEALLMAAFVLMKQNRMGIIADRRDHVDLQVNLLTERRATDIIRMLNRLSVHLGVEQPPDRQELERRVEVEHVIEEVHRRLPGDTIR
jgi:uncharacterized membrane protein